MLPEETKNLLFKNRYYILVLVFGIFLVSIGLVLSKIEIASTEVEVLEATTEAQASLSEIIVEIEGEVLNPGVYTLSKNARVEDLLVAAGGVTPNADRDWMGKTLNRAAKLADGQKIYIPAVGEQSGLSSAKNVSGYQTVSSDFSIENSGLVNINTATLSQLDSLPGIGPKYGQSIIDHRRYSNIEELVSKDALTQSVYDKIKDLVTVY